MQCFQFLVLFVVFSQLNLLMLCIAIATFELQNTYCWYLQTVEMNLKPKMLATFESSTQHIHKHPHIYVITNNKNNLLIPLLSLTKYPNHSFSFYFVQNYFSVRFFSSIFSVERKDTETNLFLFLLNSWFISSFSSFVSLRQIFGLLFLHFILHLIHIQQRISISFHLFFGIR